MSFNIKKITKKQLGIGLASTVFLAGAVYASVNEIQRNKANDIETTVSSELTDYAETETSSVATTETTEYETQSYVVNKLSDSYEAIVIQNDLVIAQTGNGDSYDWEIYDNNLNRLNTISDVKNEKNELAHSFDTSMHVNGTGVITHEKDEVYSTILDIDGSLKPLFLGERDPIGNSSQPASLTMNQYDIIPVYQINDKGERKSYVSFVKGDYREDSFSSKRELNAIGDINKNGLFSVEGKDKYSIEIYDAKLKERTEEQKKLSKTLPVYYQESRGLFSLSNINDNNVILIKKQSGDELISEFYFLDTNETVTLPTQIDVLSYPDYSLRTKNEAGLTMNDIGNADAFPYYDKIANQMGIIDKTGNIIKEPFANQISKPNKNGMAPFLLDVNGTWGIINVNTGEVVKEPFAKVLFPFNDNGLSTMLEKEGEDYSLINEKGDILEKDVANYLYPINNDNLVKYNSEDGAEIGIMKIEVNSEE